MALRVLLADESTSIKKVMQVALQDFGVEVKAVPVGVDVVSVTRSWTPDIIFVDVLLAKRSGYEVSADLKADALLQPIPIVMMWSGFMDIDEAKFEASGANRKLEKPFDADTLRGLVRELVPSTSKNKIAEYLSFPNLPDFVETRPPTVTEPAQPQAPVATLEMEEPEEFTQVPLSAKTVTEKDNWERGHLDRFKIQMPADDFAFADLNAQSLEDAPIELAGGGEVSLADLEDNPGQGKTRTKTTIPSPSHAESLTFGGGTAANSFQLDPIVAEQALRDHVRSVLQDVAWKIIPDIAERIVREELQKLLKESEKLSGSSNKL